ncbi:MAG TPA: phytanoyl-CoA dioxygenase family protein, partial [Stellaceae bacterium]|nr:phytanoyl-CoA dioxygenase family protein [Stellaceae bacterium]
WGVLPEPFGSLFRNDSLVRAAQSLLRTPNLALYLNRILLKDSDWSGAVSPHQDMPYFSGGTEKLAVFLPLSRTLARGGNGGLIFLKGSHRYGNLQRGTIRRELFPPMEELAPDLEVGDAILMNFLTWHFSEAAAVPAERPMLQIVYQPASDGSYGTAKLGVPEPTLVSGTWQTRYFAAWGVSTVPDT